MVDKVPGKMINPDELVNVRISTEDGVVTRLYLNGQECPALEAAFEHKGGEIATLKVVIPVGSMELDGQALVEKSDCADWDHSTRRLLDTVLFEA